MCAGPFSCALSRGCLPVGMLRVGSRPVLFDPVLPDGTVLNRPLPRSLVAFAAVSAGMIAGRALDLPAAAMFGLAALACAIAATAKGAPCKAALVLAAACFGTGWFALQLREPSPGALSQLVPGSGQSLITVEGVVLDTPRRAEPDPDPMAPPAQEPGLRAELSTRSLITDSGATAASGRLWVRAPASSARESDSIRAGDRVRLTGIFTPIGPRLNPGEMDRQLWAAQSGYAGSLRVEGLGGAARVEGNWWSAIEGSWLSARAWLADRTRALLMGEAEPEPGVARVEGGMGRRPVLRSDGRALLGALILGEEDPALRESRGAFNRLGLAHILSISGFHIAVMTAVGLLLLRAAGDLGWVEPVLTAALILLYLAILPFNAPVWRSGLMVLGLIAADGLGRRYDRLALLGWIATILILWRPLDLWSLGFQLSFGLVALLIWLGTPFHQRLWGARLKGPRPTEPTLLSAGVEGLKKLISTNVLCCLAATPVVMYQTGLVSTGSILAGIVLVPLITVVLIAGYATVLLGVLVPPLSAPAAALIALLAGWTTWLVRWIDEAPWTSLRVPSLSIAWAVVATAVALYWLARGHRRDWPGLGLLAAVLAWLGAELWLGPRLSPDIALRIDTLAVGDGTCHLVRSGREALLWDCGSLSPGVGRMLVPRAVRALGAWQVPIVVITHPNLDHFNGVLDIAEPLCIRTVLIGEAFADHAQQHPRSPEAYMLAELARRRIQVRTISAGERVTVGAARFEFLSPPKGADWPKDNDMSLVASVTLTGSRAPSLLLCGDIQDQALDLLAARTPALHPPILEPPHPGTPRQAPFPFAADTDPKVVLQSTGPSRAMDARWADVRAGRTWLCTATDGACFAEVHADGSIRAGKSPR